jgi:drug/metabolite transporter (DMT)-like permease
MPQVGVWWGLAGAIGFGSGDFCGGLASRRLSAVVVAALTGGVGLLLLLAVALVTGAAVPPLANLGLAALAGIGGGLGLAALYQAMATGAMGLVAALSSAGSVSLALLVGVVLGQAMTGAQVAGVACAVGAAVLASGIARGPDMVRSLRYGALSALGFGIYLILIDRAATPDPWWVLVASRGAATVAITILAVARRDHATVTRSAFRSALPLVIAGGTLDSIGNVFFIYSRSVLPVGLAAALTGLYPLATMLLARVLLGESLPRGGLLSVGLAVGGVVLISIG